MPFMTEAGSDEPLLELVRVCRSFQEGSRLRYVLQGLDLEIHEGSLVVLLGRSGSGKSTLLNLISGIDLPDEGDVRFKGRSLNGLSEHERTLFRRRNIGFVFQAFNLIPTLTVEENVRMPLELNGISDRSRRVQSLLGQVGLQGRASSYPDKLSGGEQQRVAVARAVAHEPEILLADEPTGNLDADTASDVLELIRQMVTRERRTTIIATHDRDLLRLADRVITLQNGRLEEADVDTAAR